MGVNFRIKRIYAGVFKKKTHKKRKKEKRTGYIKLALVRFDLIDVIYIIYVICVIYVMYVIDVIYVMYVI